MKPLFLDTETNGLFDYSKPADAEGQPRLAHLTMYARSGRSVWAKVNVYIRPVGWQMTPETTRINGLTDDKLEEYGIPVREALDVYTHFIESGYCVVAFNADYDLKVLRGELRRAKLDDLYSRTPSICCMKPCTDICKIPKPSGRGGYKWPKLSEAMQFLGLEQTGAHTALGDTDGCMQVYDELRRRGVDLTPKVPIDKPNTEGRPDAPAAPREQLQALREGRPALDDDPYRQQ